jgi:hypothetical protein
MKYNLFVDESCHLEHDKIPVMCIGYVKVPVVAYDELKKDLINLKLAFKNPTEVKWNKFSESRLPLYKAMVDFFFDKPLDFRCVLIKHKERLNYNDLNRGTHDNFYYKMTYYLLRPNPVGLEYRVFIDIKDSRGKEKLKKIDEVFKNHHKGDSPFVHFQHLRSEESVFFQLTDLFIGAIAFKSRGLHLSEKSNKGKIEFVNYLESKSKFSLNESIPLWETKFNIFDFQPSIK